MKTLDDIELRNKKRGDTLFYRYENLYTADPKPPIETTIYVTSINKNFIYARGNFDKHTFNNKCKYKFRLNDGYEITDRGYAGRCYSSKEFYDRTVDFDTKRSTITDYIERMHTESDMHLVDVMYELMNNWEK